MKATGKKSGLSSIALVALTTSFVVIAAFGGAYAAVKMTGPQLTTIVTASQSTSSPAISIESFCASITNDCIDSSGYSIIFKNVANSTIEPGIADIYFIDANSQANESRTCSLFAPVPANYTYTCTGPLSSAMNSGDSLSANIVFSDGASFRFEAKISGPPPAITLTSATLFAGSLSGGSSACTTSGEAYVAISLNNPFGATNITSFTLTGSSLGATVSSYFLHSGICSQIVSSSGSGYTEPNVAGEQITALTVYFASSSGSLASGQTFNYVIDFSDGESVSGSLVAQ